MDAMNIYHLFCKKFKKKVDLINTSINETDKQVIFENRQLNIENRIDLAENMQPWELSILKNYFVSDWQKRLNLFLEYPQLRNEFIEIEKLHVEA